MFRPDKARRMVTPVYLYTATLKRKQGVVTKEYTQAGILNCNFSSFGGTESVVDGVLSIEDTATVTTWYNPAITSGCRIQRISDGAFFEIIGTPENIEERNQITQFKVKRIAGGA